MIELAYDLPRAHVGQVRLNGSRIFALPGAVEHLLKMHSDDATIIAGLLHDVPDETSVTIDEIRKNFGDDIATLVDRVGRLGTLKYHGIERYADNLRKLFILHGARHSHYLREVC